MRTACFVGVTVVIAAMLGCGSEATQSPAGGTTSSTTTGPGTGGGGGTTTTSSAGGSGGMGQGGGGGAGGAGGTMVCDGLGDPCSECLAAQCQGTWCACYNNPECVTLLLCFQDCAPGDQMCIDNCMAQSPGGVADAALVGDCSDQNCPMDCPSTGIMLNPCQECIFMSCPTQTNNCYADPDCQNILLCVQQQMCTDQDCFQMCAAMYPDGQQAATPLLLCAASNCLAQCQMP